MSTLNRSGDSTRINSAPYARKTGSESPAGDAFTILRRGETLATFAKGERTIGEVIELMAGGAELQSLLGKGEEIARHA